MNKRKPSEHFQSALDETTAAGLELTGSVLSAVIIASAIERAAHIVADAIDRARAIDNDKPPADWRTWRPG